VPTFTDFGNPFVRLPKDASILAAEEAFLKFCKDILELEDDFTKANEDVKYPYIHLYPSKVDISLSV
jgi:hypothetical protein